MIQKLPGAAAYVKRFSAWDMLLYQFSLVRNSPVSYCPVYSVGYASELVAMGNVVR
jgi:hypothetical protein